ncbi:MAG: TetR/AcrR family transcriptional regulator [Peptococcaceae bacterium]|nr:TetR/AcrR family transcriptional regulator [Peptococcaceae bacterium]
MVEKANKRELILAAAREIFGEKGYHSTTSEEIAKKAGVGKGTIYQYFESKQDIFLQMHMQYLKQYSENVVALIQENSTFEENLRRIIRYHLDNLQDLIQFGVQFMSRMQTDETKCTENHAVMEEVKKQLGVEQYKLFDVAKERGEIIDVNPQLLITCFSGMCVGIAHMVGMRELSAEEKQQMEESLIRIVLHGLAQK